jgi:phage portal protein BeeE
MLARSGAVSNWGTGIEEQNVGLGRTVLSPWAQRLDQRLSRLLPRTQWAEFDFAGLERANPEDEIRLLLEQVAGGLLTVDEARAIRNLPPLGPASPPAAPATPEVPA